MATLAEVKGHAIRLFGKGENMHALRLFDAIVAAEPLEFEARLRVADCLAALDRTEQANEVYRTVARYALKAGHPLLAVVIARVLEAEGEEADDLLTALVARYGSESGLLGTFAARINLPRDTTDIAAPNLHASPAADFVDAAAHRGAHGLDEFDDYPEHLHAVPLLSALSETAFRRVLGTLVVRRLPDGAHVVREGEPGDSFYFVASGEVRVYKNDGFGRETELARLHENSVFGEMALLSAQPRSASVQVVGEADLLEVTRESIAALADELTQVADALHVFTRDRLLRNLMASNPLFKPFNRSQQRDLLRRFTSHDAAPDTDIIREGNEGQGLFVVLTGELDVHKSVGGVSTPLAVLRTGDVFGEMSLLRGAPTTATVTARRHTTVLFLAREYVERMVAGIPAIKQYLEALSEDRALDTQLAIVEDDDDFEIVEDDVVLI